VTSASCHLCESSGYLALFAATLRSPDCGFTAAGNAKRARDGMMGRMGLRPRVSESTGQGGSAVVGSRFSFSSGERLPGGCGPGRAHPPHA
jgi:hypothetical protein